MGITVPWVTLRDKSDTVRPGPMSYGHLHEMVLLIHSHLSIADNLAYCRTRSWIQAKQLENQHPYMIWIHVVICLTAVGRLNNERTLFPSHP